MQVEIMDMKLIILGEDIEAIEILQTIFANHPALSARQLDPSQIPRLQELDALYLTLPAAERWNPRLLFYESQVLKTRPEDQEEWPVHIVTGIAMKTSDPRAGDPVAELKLTIKAVLHAIQSYNREHQHPISTIGFWTRELGINRMDVSTAGDIIRSV